MSSHTVAVILSATNATQIVTRILNGWFADRKIVPATVQFAAIFAFSCLAAFLAAFLPGLPGNASVPLLFVCLSYPKVLRHLNVLKVFV